MPELIELTPSPDDVPPPRRKASGGVPRSRRLALVAAAAVLVLGLGYAARHLPQGSTTPVATPTTAGPAATVSRDGPQASKDLLLVIIQGFQADRYFAVEENPEGPFVDCGHTRPPAAEDVLAGTGVIFTRHSTPTPAGVRRLTQEILLYRPGSNIAGLRYDVPAWLAGSCAGVLTVRARSFAGDESILLQEEPQATGLGHYHALVATADYLVWLDLAVAPSTPGLATPDMVDFMLELSRRSVARIQCGGFIPTC